MANSKTKYWMMKTDAAVYSFEDLRNDNITCWEGVRNFLARNHMKSMKRNDLVLFYHSNCKDKGIAGVAKVVKEAYPDHFALDSKSKYFDKRCSAEKNLWSMVDIVFYKEFKQLVSLSEVRKKKSLEDMQLVKAGNRLSVFPVTKQEFSIICKMGL